MKLEALFGLVLVAVASVQAAPSVGSGFDHAGSLFKRSLHPHNALGRRQDGSRWLRKCKSYQSNFNVNTAPTTQPPAQTQPPQAQPEPQPQPQPEPEPQPQPQPQQPSIGGQEGEFLNAHNEARARHGANPLQWSNELADTAGGWGSNCQFKHSGIGFGENLAAGTGSMSPRAAVQAWMNEVGEYDPGNPQASHFTQVVWKGSERVGCKTIRCPGGTIFSAASDYIVCEYQPAGNVIGRFPQNVQK